MQKEFVIIKKDNTPLMFSDNVVVVYRSLTSARKDFDAMWDKTIVTLNEYKNSKEYKQYNLISVEL